MDVEWLVTDRRGLFAMGAAPGPRTRKYHSFLAEIAGRGESSLIADFALECNGTILTTHSFTSPDGPVRTARGAGAELVRFLTEPNPRWTWGTRDGRLSAELFARSHGGFALEFHWEGTAASKLVVRPFFAMRPL